MDLRQTPAWRRLFGVTLTCGVCLLAPQESEAQFRRFGFSRSQPQPPQSREIDTSRSQPGYSDGGDEDAGEPGYARAERSAPPAYAQERSSRGGLLGKIFGRGRSSSTELPEPPPARGDRTEKKKSELLNPRDLQPIRERPVVPTLPGAVTGGGSDRNLEAPRSPREGTTRREPVAMEPAGRATISGPRRKAPPPETSTFVPPPPREAADDFFSEGNDDEEGRTLDLDGAPTPRRSPSAAPQPLPQASPRPLSPPAAQVRATPFDTAESNEAVDEDIAAPLNPQGRPDADGEMLDDTGDAPEGEGPSTATVDDVEPAEEPADEPEVALPGDLEEDTDGAPSVAVPPATEPAGQAPAPPKGATQGDAAANAAPSTVREEEEELGSAFDSPYRSAPIDSRTAESQRVERPGTPASRVTPPAKAAVPMKTASLPNRPEAAPPAASNAPLVPPKAPSARESDSQPADPSEVTNRARATDAAEVVPTPRVANPVAGMMGYCPVALKDQRELVPVQADIQSRFGGKVYQFSSAEAREAFDANPRRYMPSLNGFDVVRNAFGERQVAGSLQYAAWYRGRLYLFQSAQTLQMFVQTPGRYVEFP
ncbi:MAG: hypothetical protein ACKO3P_06275 [Planctomycetaceae bacterium]